MERRFSQIYLQSVAVHLHQSTDLFARFLGLFCMVMVCFAELKVNRGTVRQLFGAQTLQLEVRLEILMRLV